MCQECAKGRQNVVVEVPVECRDYDHGVRVGDCNGVLAARDI